MNQRHEHKRQKRGPLAKQQADDPVEGAAGPSPSAKAAPMSRSEPEGVADLDLDLKIERVETEGVMKEGFSGQEM